MTSVLAPVSTSGEQRPVYGLRRGAGRLRLSDVVRGGDALTRSAMPRRNAEVESDTMTDLFSLDGTVAIVTGASKEMGAAIALLLAEHGADVAVTARTEPALAAVAVQIRA